MVIRATVLNEEPRCYVCGGGGTEADYVDHVRPLAEGGSDERYNLRRICRACSNAKTGRESARARG
jgi:5-methylcytosine-specific restriction protein A